MMAWACRRMERSSKSSTITCLNVEAATLSVYENSASHFMTIVRAIMALILDSSRVKENRSALAPLEF
jgi:hypothetical protein